MGVGPPDKPPPGPLFSVRSRLIAGAVFAVLYSVTFGPRSGWVAGILSGVLGGVVVFLVLREVDARRRRRRR